MSLRCGLATGDEFGARYSSVSERNVIKRLPAAPTDPRSLVSGLRAARENARTVREAMPSGSRELISVQRRGGTSLATSDCMVVCCF